MAREEEAPGRRPARPLAALILQRYDYTMPMRSALVPPLCFRWLVGSVLTVLAAGCHDSPADPLGAPTTVETVPSLALAAPLPDLPELVTGTSPSSEIRVALAAWQASWDDASGEVDRASARAVVAGHLAGVLDARGVEEALRSLLWAEMEVSELPPLPAELAVPLEEARVLTEQAAAARRDGRLRDALEAGLAAADRYRSVTPEAVARRLVARGRSLLDAATAEAEASNPPKSGTPVTDRARHLVDGAARALASGDHLIAVQRAFYGIQVLEGRMVDVDPRGPDAPGAGEDGDTARDERLRSGG